MRTWRDEKSEIGSIRLVPGPYVSLRLRNQGVEVEHVFTLDQFREVLDDLEEALSDFEDEVEEDAREAHRQWEILQGEEE